tara:strand:+ start:4790 stop:5008 length:219 start_codon:yes stop_codon:yes gene_type:complete
MENKYKHPHFLILIMCIMSIVAFTFITQGCATTAQLYVDPHYKIQPDRAYPELQIGMKINIGPKITFKKKNK